MKERVRLVIVAALKREIASVVASAKKDRLQVTPHQFEVKYWRLNDAVVIAAGTGWERAAAVTKVAIETFQPELITSVGFSGSQSGRYPAGALYIPSQVIGFKDGVEYRTGLGEGVLFTSERVAGAKEKSDLALRRSATAVDMEAAAVAKVAQSNGIRFVAIKAISDGIDDRIEFVRPFVTPEGFRTGAFVAHIAVRPWLWGDVAKLAGNSRKASATLAQALLDFVSDPNGFLNRYSTPDAGSRSSALQGGE